MTQHTGSVAYMIALRLRGSSADLLCVPRYRHVRQHAGPSAKSPFSPRCLPESGLTLVIRDLYHNYARFIIHRQNNLSTGFCHFVRPPPVPPPAVARVPLSDPCRAPGFLCPVHCSGACGRPGSPARLLFRRLPSARPPCPSPAERPVPPARYTVPVPAGARVPLPSPACPPKRRPLLFCVKKLSNLY